MEYALEVKRELEEQGIYTHLDQRNERLGRKIRDAQVSKTKFQIVIGDDELSTKTINVRAYGEKKQISMTMKELLSNIK